MRWDGDDGVLLQSMLLAWFHSIICAEMLHRGWELWEACSQSAEAADGCSHILYYI